MKVTRIKTTTGVLVHFPQPAAYRAAPRFAKDHPLVHAMSEQANWFVGDTLGGVVVRRVRDGRVYAESVVPRRGA